MCDNEWLNKYASWIDEATSKEELLDTLYDIRDDLTGEYDDDGDDDEGGYSISSCLGRNVWYSSNGTIVFW